MKRFLAVVGLVAFVAACSDSNTTTPLAWQRGVGAAFARRSAAATAQRRSATVT